MCRRPGRFQKKKMGTCDTIFVLNTVITHFINTNKKLYCAFIDFSTAFDHLVHQHIWYKLIRLGIRGKRFSVIQSIYESVKSRVKMQNRVGNEFDCLLGVRQGESLSPFLYSMYINDLENELCTKGFKGIDITLMKMFLIMYADDIIIMAETPEDLQLGLNILEQYCNKCKLKLNKTKTK